MWQAVVFIQDRSFLGSLMESSTNLQTETSSTEETKMRELKNTDLEDVAGGFIERRPIVYKIIDLVGKYLNQN